MRVRPVLGLMLAGLCVLPVAAHAQQQPQLTADQIVQRMLAQDAFGWEGARTRVRMILTARGTARRERVIQSMSRRKDGRLQMLVRFLSPSDVAGTAFLMIERGGGASEQYIYLPGLHRTRRITGREREGSFMGSDFSYADFDRRDTRDSVHRKLPDETIGGVPAYVIESVPRRGAAESAYGRIQSWVRRDNFLPLRVRFFDRRGRSLKTLYGRRIRNIEGRPVVVEIRIDNHQTLHTTELVVDQLERRRDLLTDAQFTPTALEHG